MAEAAEEKRLEEQEEEEEGDECRICRCRTDEDLTQTCACRWRVSAYVRTGLAARLTHCEMCLAPYTHALTPAAEAAARDERRGVQIREANSPHQPLFLLLDVDDESADDDSIDDDEESDVDVEAATRSPATLPARSRTRRRGAPSPPNSHRASRSQFRRLASVFLVLMLMHWWTHLPHFRSRSTLEAVGGPRLFTQMGELTADGRVAVQKLFDHFDTNHDSQLNSAEQRVFFAWTGNPAVISFDKTRTVTLPQLSNIYRHPLQLRADVESVFPDYFHDTPRDVPP
eukprot:gnl/Spiro4/2811_TR1369_c0_g1_i2.p1 gnl/Spiro4/2811_TR1369_c0_g1~~gnl/Spiro4/2811_TR1369_c0_g1_i2.p1  ORF type:complete len:286 (-),score=75.83 gnl/Spiro4/2811_TR1369_c0_g1_i2:121-978(-)